jgi:hypothetical protein
MANEGFNPDCEETLFDSESDESDETVVKPVKRGRNKTSPPKSKRPKLPTSEPSFNRPYEYSQRGRERGRGRGRGKKLSKFY